MAKIVLKIEGNMKWFGMDWEECSRVQNPDIKPYMIPKSAGVSINKNKSLNERQINKVSNPVADKFLHAHYEWKKQGYPDNFEIEL
jgi:hypothetical protein